MRNSVLTFKKMKEEGKKISMLTCYDYTTAKLMDGKIDAILVGDSVGNTMLGFGDTIPVTVDHMITYGGSVVRGTETTMIVVDMPFMSYQVSMEQALENAGRIMKETHCQAIKLEGGARVCPQIRAMVDAGIPVMAHLGLTPQSINAFGGCRVQGKTEDAARELLEDAYAVQEAGAFSVVLECIPAPVAALITSKLEIDVRDQLIVAKSAAYSFQYDRVFFFSTPAVCHAMSLDEYCETICAPRTKSRLS